MTKLEVSDYKPVICNFYSKNIPAHIDCFFLCLALLQHLVTMKLLGLLTIFKLCFCFTLFKQSWCMFSKRQLPVDLPTCSPSKRLRHNLVDLFLSNDVSGARADSLLRDAAAADSKHISDLVSKRPSKKHTGNAPRD